MKKILLSFVVLVFALSNYLVFADEEVLYATVEPTKYAETYIESEVNLFSDNKTLEQTLTEGWENLSTEISIEDYEISIFDIAEKYAGILFNNPTLYYVDTGFGYRYSPNTNRVSSVLPNYTETNKSVISETIEAVNEATEEILLCLDESMTDFEKIMTVHDYMVIHYEYDYTYSNYDITIMTTKTGVCMAYSMAFKHLMDKIGIECLYVSSSDEMNHGWNLVKLDDEWYHIDLTWDDPGTMYSQVRHEYALLSDYEIQNLESPHYGYDLKGLEANSDKYDKKQWHEGIGAIVTIDKVYYYVANDNLIDQNGRIIYENLSGDGNWNIGGNYYFPSVNYTGLAEHNGILYFNTDKAVYSYNPKKDKVSKVLEYDGICGLFIDKNTLEYGKFDTTEKQFIQAGKYNLGKIRFGGTFHNNGKIVKRIYKDLDADDIYVYAQCKDCIHTERIMKAGVSKISFDTKDCQTLFYWDREFKPLKEKELYNQ